MNDNSNLNEKDFLETAWNYFSLHSNQRIQLLNFYIVIESLFVTGMFAIVQMENSNLLINICVCLAVILFSFVFWSLDVRTKKLIKHSENAFKFIEEKYKGTIEEKLLLFTTEFKNTSEKSFLNFTYSKMFNVTYLFFTAIGIGGLIFSVFYL